LEECNGFDPLNKEVTKLEQDINLAHPILTQGFARMSDLYICAERTADKADEILEEIGENTGAKLKKAQLKNPERVLQKALYREGVLTKTDPAIDCSRVFDVFRRTFACEDIATMKNVLDQVKNVSTRVTSWYC
jgi:hypothetical protein